MAMGTGFFVFFFFFFFFLHKGIISAVKRPELICDKISYLTLRGHWCDIIVLNVHAPTEAKSADAKVSFYYNMKTLLEILIQK
jgi:hypothetical protein